MSNRILVTDSLFIFDEHVKQIENAGYQVERLDKPQASEDELIDAIKGKVGYILGGIEKVTDKVIDAADSLKAIVFTGIDYKNFVPAWDKATQKGIAIANIPDGPTQAVAEWAIGATLLMNRGFLELGRTGKNDFMTTKGIESQNIGIIGFGRIGNRIAEMLVPFKPHSINYWSPNSRDQKGIANYQELDDLLASNDILYISVPAHAKGLLDRNQVAKIKDKALLVNFTHGNVVDQEALLEALKAGRIRATSDDPADDVAFNDLPLSTWFSFNGSNAFNTKTGIKTTSDMATKSLLNLLSNGEDQYLVNPEYRK